MSSVKKTGQLAHESVFESPVEGSSNATFGRFFAGFFALVEFIHFYKTREWMVWPIAVAFIFLGLAMLRPQVLSPMNRAWTRLGLLMHLVMGPLVLGVTYYLVFSPYALVLRMFGRASKFGGFEKARSSYWEQRESWDEKRRSAAMERQF